MHKTVIQYLVGPVAILLSLFGIQYGIRTSMAQNMYFKSRYGSWKNNVELILSACERASDRYAWNYNFCSVAADAAFNAASRMMGKPADEMFVESGKWCERGLSLNRYSFVLCVRKTLLLDREESTRPEAIRVWSSYTAWHYWHPYNHYLLGVLCAKAGDISRAEECKDLIAGSPYRLTLEQVIDEEKQKLRAAGQE